MRATRIAVVVLAGAALFAADASVLRAPQESALVLLAGDSTATGAGTSFGVLELDGGAIASCVALDMPLAPDDTGAERAGRVGSEVGFRSQTRSPEALRAAVEAAIVDGVLSVRFPEGGRAPCHVVVRFADGPAGSADRSVISGGDANGAWVRVRAGSVTMSIH